ncbi:CaiB/BaiF CoA-transferase family protein [Bradyrhizobium sp. CB82]|uniref:CaiB/BaiF CoA transferase family protein n=1 Tax=Bradyrhizobium sp. CB82 TaxID=3039159 RepID=UPI0024B16C55|nr:CaiB/BaiF CoA-transferase family protein [Bradyrhizobium sp. CB82]WFU41516.1 CaiB/BaiF CoA-transferase family protein [Bradyrhizobium sp. CB82]
MSKISSELPLAGIKIVDLTQVQFGPSATQVLGDFGAEIIKIERPGHGDISRSLDPFVEPGGQSTNFLALNRNKRSVAVDITKPAGAELLRRLAQKADVLVHNFRPGVLERLDLGYEVLSSLNPRLIFAAGSGFGLTGPLAGKPGQDLLAQSLSGLAMRNPDREGRPQLHPTAIADFTAGMLLAQGLLLALFHRERTGRGQSLHVSLLDTLLAMQLQEATQWMLRQKEINWLKLYPMRIFRTKDGAITVVAVFRPNPIADICSALELDDITQNPAFSTREVQMKNIEQLETILGVGFARFTTGECIERLERKDVLCAPVLSIDEALAHPQTVENGMIIELPDPTYGTIRTTANPVHLSSVPDIAKGPCPLLGEHTVAVAQDAGFGEEEIRQMLEAGVLQQA